MDEFEILGPNDKPALVAVTAPDIRAISKDALVSLGYKVHTADDHTQFDSRFSQASYRVIIIDEAFSESTAGENPTLRLLQHMPMNQRRHAVLILVGSGFETLNSLQAFSRSVHCVVNYAELAMLGQIVQKTTADSDTFLATFREVERRIYQKG